MTAVTVGENVVDEPSGSVRGRAAWLIPGLAVALVALALVSAGIGQLPLTPLEVLHTLLQPVGIEVGAPPAQPNAEAALWSIRLPRVAMAILVGAALAAAGLLMQAVFGNPLAEPAVVGVSSGAALGAAASIVLGWTVLGGWTTAVAAFVAGLITTLLVYASSRSGGRTEIVTLVLTGIAVNAVAQAGLALFVFLGDTQSREEIVFWQLGSLNGSMWREVGIVLPIVLVAAGAAAFLTRRLDLLSLGERSARHLGVNVEVLRAGTIVLVALLVSAAVAFTGIIGFVGIVVPHLMRMILGPAHGPLLAASLLGGAVLLTAADLAARTIVPYADLPIGMLTALVGGPFFFWLLRRTRAKAGGWG
jgi:iron complex transport system permease protein